LKLTDEPSVRLSLVVFAAHVIYGLLNGPPVGGHEISGHDAGGPTHSLDAMHEHAPPVRESISDEGGRATKVAGELLERIISNGYLEHSRRGGFGNLDSARHDGHNVGDAIGDVGGGGLGGVEVGHVEAGDNLCDHDHSFKRVRPNDNAPRGRGNAEGWLAKSAA